MLVNLNSFSMEGNMQDNGEQQVKRQGTTLKRLAEDNGEQQVKRQGINLKRVAEDMTEKYSKFGAYGDYEVKTPSGQDVTVVDAITIRILDHGELNLVTGSGHWFLFAPNSWTSVQPLQPGPGMGVA
jgi:hypothetical protein